MKKQQTGGTIVGFIVGVIVGLGAALAVAVYVTKVPVPFLNKGNGRGVDMDAAETQKNKNWDPNSPLYGKNPARPAAPPAVAASAPTPAAPDARAVASAPAPKPAASKPEAKAETKPGADPLGDLAVAKAAAKGNLDPFDYFVQAGAFRTQADADAQRAKLAMLGWEARVSEREQNGRAVFRVRVGPFTKRDDAEQLKEKLDGAGLESALVRVQR
ncbi:SPOR domain-containing protein [Acidovorax facilis]|jgi:cell division protein FtsN|uniref:SPOR domain-containing protein n=1 Tax=Acidovorax facilis TaxID=12917 RepID=A0ABV8DIM0_9BURK|nr:MULTISPECIES: SPOR domain-containing protein [Acidovorax]ODS65844.1 MAG: sporulation protein [Acidovorax sp. SCN 65-108]OGA60455.1 MAG: sporulation protein [Burkholderiales bacterium RIFCSPHIGHO2_01_FULL_64_960]OGB07013.1 MAG: sporulation protein [Burkholderiales bacterium RIFCSPHIGHO2_02_FULL_64_19]OGB26342.1 MAG: sporulation protein [Burkholderiales bacterium RIFCSPHIGHO2_12_FULL_65_48]OGB54617.1 MAG: sporulation protein [Burkholderiales bacterium RIFCSPLOWO2_12_FULL_64_33]OJV74512.1 MAG